MMLPPLAFFIAALVLAVTPGPGIAYVVARTAAGGRAEGLASCVGTGLGGMLTAETADRTLAPAVAVPHVPAPKPATDVVAALPVRARTCSGI